MNYLRNLIKSLTILSVILLFGFASVQAATVNVTTKYGQTGGLRGVLNTAADQVNGRSICAGVSDANPIAGCDISSDAGYSNNGTINDPTDDTYSGDLIVRTNDSFEAMAAWNWNGVAGGAEETITIVGTLPATGEFAWDNLPSYCHASGSSISEDRLTLTCLRKDFDNNDAGSYAEDLSFPVLVKGDVEDGTQPGDITFTISGQNAATKTDTTDGNSLTVTAAPRWNLDKTLYTFSAGYEHNGESGFLLYYKYYIEVDEVSGETDDASAVLGNESLGSDATVTFTDDLSAVSAHAELIACDADTWSNGSDPYPYFNATYPDRSVATPAGTQVISCSQAAPGGNIDVTLEHSYEVIRFTCDYGCYD